MIGSRNICLFFISIQIIFINFNSFADDVLDENDVSKFQYECRATEGYNIDLKFAPVEKLSEEFKSEDQWSYKFVDKQYPKTGIKLSEDGSVRVDLVLILKRSESEIGESYLWNVIVGPRNTGWKFGGFWPTKESIHDYLRLSKKVESLIDIATLSSFSDGFVHTQIPYEDVDKSTKLNSAWIDLFGEKIVSDLVYSGTSGAINDLEGYSLTFYHVPTPALRLINDDGYKWPSFKHIDKPGKVFGFVLSPDGKCLAETSIKVVK
jgi:hypothetical protein